MNEYNSITVLSHYYTYLYSKNHTLLPAVHICL